MKYSLKRLDETGDSALATWDPAVAEDVEAAEKIFDQLRSEGMWAYKVAAAEDGTVGVKINSFEPDADIIIHHQLQGG